MELQNPGPAGPEQGQVIAGKYRLLRELSRGGMGSVWVAYHEVLDIQVAIKLLTRHRDDTELVAERMRVEAQVAARLDHPNIISVHDLGYTEQGDPYIVMELLEGHDLRERLIESGPLSPAEAVRVLLPILEALNAAHGQGVIHRDLKPENVFLVRRSSWSEPWPKLLDFGIARAEKNSDNSARRRLTTQGTILGSVNFLAPEQARGEEIDSRADLWSFSAMLFECITGAPPFPGDDVLQVLCAIIEEPMPSLGALGYDVELSAILDRGLMRDREQRWQSAADMGAALASWLEAQGMAEDVCQVSVRARWLSLTPHLDGVPSRPAVRGTRRRSNSVTPITRIAVSELASVSTTMKRGLWVAAAGIALLAVSIPALAQGWQNEPHPAMRALGAVTLPAPPAVERGVPASPLAAPDSDSGDTAQNQPPSSNLSKSRNKADPASTATRAAPERGRSSGFDPVLGF